MSLWQLLTKCAVVTLLGVWVSLASSALVEQGRKTIHSRLPLVFSFFLSSKVKAAISSKIQSIFMAHSVYTSNLLTINVMSKDKMESFDLLEY